MVVSSTTSNLKLVAATANPHKLLEIKAIWSTADSAQPSNAQTGKQPDKQTGKQLLAIEILPRPENLEVPEESEPTLLGNARIKALHVARFCGAPAVADDTGLEVDALGGAPGVRSARFAGDTASYEENVRLLLEKLLNVPPDQRTARFRTVAMVCWPTEQGNHGSNTGSEIVREISAEGILEGSIALRVMGDGGFGYDPVFIPEQAVSSQDSRQGSRQDSRQGNAPQTATQQASESQVATQQAILHTLAEMPGRTLAEMTANEKNVISARGKAFVELRKKLQESLAGGVLC